MVARAAKGEEEILYADLDLAAKLEERKVVRRPRSWWRWAAPLAAAALEQKRLLAEAETLYEQARRDSET